MKQRRIPLPGWTEAIDVMCTDEEYLLYILQYSSPTSEWRQEQSLIGQEKQETSEHPLQEVKSKPLWDEPTGLLRPHILHLWPFGNINLLVSDIRKLSLWLGKRVHSHSQLMLVLLLSIYNLHMSTFTEQRRSWAQLPWAKEWRRDGEVAACLLLLTTILITNILCGLIQASVNYYRLKLEGTTRDTRPETDVCGAAGGGRHGEASREYSVYGGTMNTHLSSVLPYIAGI